MLELKAPHDGAIVVALVDGESTLKRYFVQSGKPYLKADNPKCPDVIPVGDLTSRNVEVQTLIGASNG